MKPEPLKGKRIWSMKEIVEDFNNHQNYELYSSDLFTSNKDIKSAVEWLKEKEYILGNGKCTRCGNYHIYREHIKHKNREEDEFICFSCNLNEAFEDVMK